jgi:hypothetical protein
LFQESLREKLSINTLKFEHISKGPTPKFDVTFGRGEFSKLNQKMPIDQKRLNSSAYENPDVKTHALKKSQSASHLKTRTEPNKSTQSANYSKNPIRDEEANEEKEKHKRFLKAQKTQDKQSNSSPETPHHRISIKLIVFHFSKSST